MNDLTTTTDLIAEWESLREKKPSLQAFVQAYGYEHDKANLARTEQLLQIIAAELDRRCMDAGIAMIEGQFHYARKWFSVVLEDREHLLREVCCAEYSHAYRQWLLLKEGGRGA